MGVGTYLQSVQQTQLEIVYCGLAAPNPASDRLCLLAAGTTPTGATTRNAFAAQELAVANGYSRSVVGRQVTAVDATNDLLTIPEHSLANGTRVYVLVGAGGSVPGGLLVGVPYFVINGTIGAIQLSLTSGGAAVNITSAGSGNIFVRPSGTFNGTTNRFEGFWEPASFTATGGNLTYQGYFLLRGSSSGVANCSVSAIDTTGDVITTAVAHGLTTGDEVMITVDSGGALPGGLTANSSSFVRVLTTTTFTMHPTSADATGNTNRVDLTSTGTLPLRMRNVTGYVDGFEWFSSSQPLLDTRQQIIRVFRNTLNAGALNGV